jgi:hypothetical protein
MDRNHTALRAIAIAGIAASGLAVSVPAFAATPATIGVGVGPGIIGDMPGTTGWWPGAPYGVMGNQPVKAGHSKSWSLFFVNTGNSAERISVAQQLHPAKGYPQMPFSWAHVTQSGPTRTWAGVLQPGQRVNVTVTITVPAGTKPAMYIGTLLGSVRPMTAPPPGQTNVYPGAGQSEYIRVVR